MIETKKISATVKNWQDDYIKYMSKLSCNIYSPTLQVLLSMQCYSTACHLYDFDKDKSIDIIKLFNTLSIVDKSNSIEAMSLILHHGRRAWEHIQSQKICLKEN